MSQVHFLSCTRLHTRVPFLASTLAGRDGLRALKETLPRVGPALGPMERLPLPQLVGRQPA